MKTKLCSQLNADGYFIGTTIADESPLEPDVFLLPGGAVDAPAPAVPEGKMAKWNGAGFDLEDIPEPPQPQPPTPAVSIPSIVTMRQARLALLQSGLLSQVNAAVAAADEATQITWDYSSEVHRNHPFVATLAAALNLSDAQLDGLFTLAATL